VTNLQADNVRVMSHKVSVHADVTMARLPLTGAPNPTAIIEPHIELEDESALVLSQFDGQLVTAISPVGPNAYFNSLQIRRLLDELRAAAAPAARPVQRNLNDVADFIEGRAQSGAIERYVSFIV